MRLMGSMRLMRLIGLIVLIGLVCPMGLLSCSSDEETEETRDETPIAFTGNVGEEERITRATEGLETVTESFYVWAYKNKSNDPTAGYGDLQTVMDEYTVNWVANSAATTPTNSHDWEYVNQTPDQTIKFWDWSAKAYRFFALANEANGADYSVLGINTATGANGTFDVFKAQMDADATDVDAAPYFSKLWFNTGSQYGQPVTLEFMKPFARVRFKFTFAVEDADRTKLSYITFRPTDTEKAIADQGTVTVSYPLTGTETKALWTSEPSHSFAAFTIDYYEENTTFIPNDDQPESYPNTPEHWYIVLPRKATGTGGQGSYTLSVVVIGGEPKTCVVPAEFMTWEPGYEYTYIFKITESGGVSLDNIQVGINTWVVKESVEHPVYNW